MAAKLQCEICGGKLVGKPGGIFECESCGTEYSTEWAKAKIQEIKGTVKVEGTVDVKGSVQVEGTATAQSLIKRGNLALEDAKWNDAEKCFKDALNADPESAEAYLGLVMVKRKCCNNDAFSDDYIKNYLIIKNNSDFKRAMQFGDSELKKWIDELEEKAAIQQRISLGYRVEERDYVTDKNQANRLASVRDSIAQYRGIIAAGDYHTIGLNLDGTVVAVGKNYCGQCNVQKWTDIVAVAANGNHSVGLKSDGTVVATKYTGDSDDYSGQCNVSRWKDIVAIAAGYEHTVGLKSDGTVVATKYTGDIDLYNGQCDVSDWKDIVALYAGGWQTIGLKADGTIVVAGYENGKDNILSWTDIVAFATSGDEFTIGLKTDGTVIEIGGEELCWTDIIAIALGGEFMHIGLKADGTVVSLEEDVSNWSDIVAVAAGEDHLVGLKSDGTVLAAGHNNDGQCDVFEWKLLKSEEEKEADYAKACNLQETGEENNLAEAVQIFRGLRDFNDSADLAEKCSVAYEELKSSREERERAEREAEGKAQAEREARERAKKAAAAEEERQRKTAELNIEKSTLQTELANLKGIFSGKRRKEIEARLAQIDSELKSL